jgi:hypothetical protein
MLRRCGGWIAHEVLGMISTAAASSTATTAEAKKTP